ncbi:MAG: AAA family ATPase [Odoribacter sp.]|nr:AAA family ATPase [Odoribacter sp.]
MNNVDVRINRLGAVRDAEISLRPFMLFMGESGLGKSYVAFLAHYVYVLLNSDRLDHFFDGTDFSTLLKKATNGQKILTVTAEDLFRWINADAVTFIRYMVGHDKLDGDVEIRWPYFERNIDFIYSEELEGLANDEEMVYSISTENFVYNKLSSQSKIDARVFSLLIQAILRDAIFNNLVRRIPYVLPPSRGALLELNERPPFRSGMYDEFFNLKNALSRPLIKAKEDDVILDQLINRVNNGKVAQTDGQFVYTTSDGIPMPLTAAASSVKELAPFTMALKKFHLEQCSILFEEPEAHLHPKRQQSVADLIAYSLGKGTHMQVTTHSDYFVKRLNALLRAFRLAMKISKEKKQLLLKEARIIPEILLNPQWINAYYLSRRADGSTEIRRYNIQKEDMIPFDSFEKTILDDFTVSDMMDKVEFPDIDEE